MEHISDANMTLYSADFKQAIGIYIGEYTVEVTDGPEHFSRS